MAVLQWLVIFLVSFSSPFLSKIDFFLWFVPDSDHTWFGEKIVFPSDGQALASVSLSMTMPIRQSNRRGIA